MIGIIGAGLSGLTAGRYLQSMGHDFTILDSSSKVGGRVQSESSHGFMLDEGFQVLLTSYPMVKKYIDIDALKSKSFAPGALIFKNPGDLFKVSDPLRNPKDIISTASAPIGTLLDKLKILQLFLTKPKHNSSSILEFLQKFGFSELMINNFFRPFFSGVLLESDLRTRSDYVLFLYKMFAKGLAVLPERGMQGLVDQLSAPIKDSIRLGQEVLDIKQGSIGVDVTTASKAYNFNKLIVAMQAPVADSWFPDKGIPLKKRSVTSLYFTYSQKVKDGDYLLINASGKGCVNHIAFLSQVQPSYSLGEKHLVSVNILGNEKIKHEAVLEELRGWKIFTDDWQFLDSKVVDYAQPDSFWMGNGDINIGKHILLAGDYTQSPSIEGAMKSGELAAQACVNTQKI